MDEIEYQWLSNFIGENWNNFINFMAEMVGDEEAENESERLVEKLEKLAGMK